MTAFFVSAAVITGAWLAYRYLRTGDPESPAEFDDGPASERLATPLFRWAAQLSLDTPLWSLERHRQIWTGSGSPSQEGDRDVGGWNAVLPEDEARFDQEVAAGIPAGLGTGPEVLRVYLAFLKDFRRIVEGPDPVDDQIAQIRALPDADPSFGRVVAALGSEFPEDWFAARFTRIHGIGSGTARALFQAGFRTPADLAAASDAELQAIHGIGPSLVRQIRAQLPALTGESFEPLAPPPQESTEEGKPGIEEESEDPRMLLGDESTEFETNWKLLDDERQQFLKSGMEVEAMRIRIRMAELAGAYDRGEEALAIYLEVFLHDAAHSLGSKATQVSGQAERAARRLVRELDLDVDDVDEILAQVRDRESRTLPAWAKLGERWDALSLALLEDAAARSQAPGEAPESPEPD
jgi:hypothetical protein